MQGEFLGENYTEEGGSKFSFFFILQVTTYVTPRRGKIGIGMAASRR